MAEVERLFAEFVEAHLGGRDPDPSEYIGRVGEGDRRELEDLIDAYYVDAPPRPWDAAFQGSTPSGSWTRSTGRAGARGYGLRCCPGSATGRG